MQKHFDAAWRWGYFTSCAWISKTVAELVSEVLYTENFCLASEGDNSHTTAAKMARRKVFWHISSDIMDKKGRSSEKAQNSPKSSTYTEPSTSVNVVVASFRSRKIQLLYGDGDTGWKSNVKTHKSLFLINGKVLLLLFLFVENKMSPKPTLNIIAITLSLVDKCTCQTSSVCIHHNLTLSAFARFHKSAIKLL